MSVAQRAGRVAARSAKLLSRLARRLLRVAALLLFFVVALVLPVPILGRPPRYEHAGRQNEPTEIEKRR